MLATVTESKQFRTPRGRTATMFVREGTADHNNVAACLDGDEYGLADLELGDGLALDIGAHVGGVTIALALDNRQAHVIAVEAVGANVEVLRANVAANGLGDRVTVIHGAATRPGKKTATAHWDFDGDSVSSQHHRFIGNAQLARTRGGQSEKVIGWSLDDLPSDVAFAKIDCELCEYDLFMSPAVKRIAEIRGEFHAGFDRLFALLDATHVVTQTGGYEGTGAFLAVRR